jgi:hypothetical protein
LFTFDFDVYSEWCHVASKVILFDAMQASSRHCADYAFVRLVYMKDNLVRYFADCTSIEVRLVIVPAPGEYSAYSGNENPKPSAFIVNGELRDHAQLRNDSRSRVHCDLENTAAISDDEDILAFVAPSAREMSHIWNDAAESFNAKLSSRRRHRQRMKFESLHAKRAVRKVARSIAGTSSSILQRFRCKQFVAIHDSEAHN